MAALSTPCFDGFTTRPVSKVPQFGPYVTPRADHASSQDRMVALVRELLLLEADEVLEGDRDILADDTQHDERKLALARQLYVAYLPFARQELRRCLRQLPTMASVLADATARWTQRKRLARPTVPVAGGDVTAFDWARSGQAKPSRAALLATHADPRALELARLRLWAARQLLRIKGQEGTSVDLVVLFVYLTLRDVCDWERLHVEVNAQDMLHAAVSGSFEDARSDDGAAGEWTVLSREEQYS